VTCDCGKAFKLTEHRKGYIMQIIELEKDNVKTTKVSQALSLFWQEFERVVDIEALPKN
jgi:hypothetical protein